MSDVLSMIGLRDRIKQILLEPTLDKAFTTFASIMLVTLLVTMFAPFFTGEMQLELLIVQAVFCVGSAVAGLLFKKYDQPARDAASDRLKKQIEFDYLIKNPKLKETEITLSALEDIRDELSLLRQILCVAVKDQINGGTLDKGMDPATKDISTTPWANTKIDSDR